MLANDGCGPNEYAMFCLKSGYDLTVAHPLNEYVSNIRMKEMYDFLTRSKCYKHIESFVCAALFPKCSENPFQLTYPCKGLCEDVQERCHPVLQRYGIEWPEELNCTRFRERNCLNPETSLEEGTDRVVDAPVGRHTHRPDRQSKRKPRRDNKKRGHRDRKPPNSHAQRVDNSESEVTQSEVQPTQATKTLKMKTFLKLLKKTLDKVIANLKTLSDGI
ncbi:secreted frizzled-related protein 2-like [Haliotis rufescens]|uniref:secreted frizzled-related protein 2-like n=1 Tax=Haliotis rufescens TaxID=6454 RepID=UPI00201F6FB8|nr:secreted frizzled-related protein 2-like [Haliotis rufescens]